MRTKEEIEKSFWDFVESVDISSHIREEDIVFHDVLEYCPETNEWGVGTYSQGTHTEGWIQLYNFPNAQEIGTDNSDLELLAEDVYSDMVERLDSFIQHIFFQE